MAKFRIISCTGDGVGLGKRLADEGNEVTLYIEDPKAVKLYDGILPRVKDGWKGLDKDTIVIFDMVKKGKEADKLREQEFLVFGGSDIADKMELDRSFGLPVAENAGIAVPEWDDFQDFESAIKWVKEKDFACVFKPEHNKEGIETYVSTDSEDMIEMLENFSGIWKGKIDFVLQEVKEGIEISSEVWCVNGQIIPNSYNNTLETKRFMNDNLSKNTGCMSSTVKFNLCPDLYGETFGKLENWLKLQKYSGALDINCIISDGVPYILEWTARMGYSAIYAFIQGLNMPFGEFIASIANGVMPDLQPSDEFLGALRISIPPYPMVEEAPETEGKPVRGMDDNCIPLDVMEIEGKFYTSGYDGIICEVVGTGDTPESLWDGLYDTAKQLKIPNIQYRTDCLEDVQERLLDLEEIGLYDSNLNY
jgi:phosphoribosylamine--glycine ligase